MNWRRKFSVLFFAGFAALAVRAQTAGKYLAPRLARLDELDRLHASNLVAEKIPKPPPEALR